MVVWCDPKVGSMEMDRLDSCTPCALHPPPSFTSGITPFFIQVVEVPHSSVMLC